MLRSKKIIVTSVVLMTLFLCFQSTKSYAWWSLGGGWSEGHRHHDHEHLHFGLRVSSLPDECYTVWSGAERYYYCDGYYYSRDRVDYVVVNPPVGTVLTTVPVTYQPVVVNGVTYYTNHGIYYIYTSSGYQVVPQPTAILQSGPGNTQAAVITTMQGNQITTTTVTNDTDENTFTVNISNDKGGYTPVIIKRSGVGYVGPQGEFYAEFPKVSQLKAMYVK